MSLQLIKNKYTQYCMPVITSINSRSNRPIRPCNQTSIHPINIHHKISKDRLIHRHYIPCLCHIIQLRDTMRDKIAIVQGVRVGGLNNGSSSELRNGNVIRVSICTILTKGHDNFGLDTPQVPDNLCDNLGWVSCIKVSINIIQKIDTLNTEYRGGFIQFGFAYLSQFLQPRMLALLAEPTSLSARCGDKMGLYPFGSILSEYATVA